MPYIVLTNVSNLENFYNDFKKDVLIIKRERSNKHYNQIWGNIYKSIEESYFN